MQDVIDKFMTHPWIVGLLGLCFLVCMLGFWARIRHDAKKGKPPARQQPPVQTQ